MEKSRALELFGSVQELATCIGITAQAVYAWPDRLPERLVDRVIAGLVRSGREVPRELFGDLPLSPQPTAANAAPAAADQQAA